MKKDLAPLAFVTRTSSGRAAGGGNSPPAETTHSGKYETG